MNILKPLRPETITSVAKVLADTETGLKGHEIEQILKGCQIPDIEPAMTKWKRLANAFGQEQNKKGYSNHIVAFIHKAMSPVSHANNKSHFESKRSELNLALSFEGLHLGEDGKIRKINAAKTISEAEARASRLKQSLLSRNVHQDVLKFCKSELLQENHFHAVLEASKSIANKIRHLSGLQSDGAELTTAAFSLGASGIPMLAINTLANDTERGEQKGFVNLLVGIFGLFRNPTAHGEKIYWAINEQDALDILSTISLVHRKLDLARKP